jgi:hypothetical protein
LQSNLRTGKSCLFVSFKTRNKINTPYSAHLKKKNLSLNINSFLRLFFTLLVKFGFEPFQYLAESYFLNFFSTPIKTIYQPFLSIVNQSLNHSWPYQRKVTENVIKWNETFKRGIYSSKLNDFINTHIAPSLSLFS